MTEPIDWIQAGKRIEQFLADEAVLTLLDNLEKKYIGEIKTAEKTEDLWRAQRRLNSLDELVNALKVGQDRGEVARITQTRAEEKDKARTTSLL